MLKIETIWHHLLNEALKGGSYKHTQKGLAAEFGYSLSTINHALKVPSQMGAIRKTSKFFVLEDFKKPLYYWASVRNLTKDIIYSSYIDLPVVQREGLVPPESVYAGYTAAKKILTEPPADYSKVYLYTKALKSKDIDIIVEFDKLELLSSVKVVILQYDLRRELKIFDDILGDYFERPELDLNRHHFSRLKRRIRENLQTL